MSKVEELFGLNRSEDGFSFVVDTEGVNFFLPIRDFKAAESGDANELIMAQLALLQMLYAQDDANKIPNGFVVRSGVVTRLSKSDQELLGLPSRWVGSIDAGVTAPSNSINFKVDLRCSNPSGRKTLAYKIDGPFIVFGSAERYLLSSAEFASFEAKREHDKSNRDYASNLKLIYSLQRSREAGCRIELGHFDKMEIQIPEAVSVTVQLRDDGSLHLIPNVSRKSSPDEVEAAQVQITQGNQSALKIGGEIILLEGKRREAFENIIKNSEISKENAKVFFQNPAAFLDANLVDLDDGFGKHVKGLAPLVHAYFGATDSSGIDWFGPNPDSSLPQINAPANLTTVLKSHDDLDQFRRQFAAAEKIGAHEISYEGELYDVSDSAEVNRVLVKIQERLNSSPPGGNPTRGPTAPPEPKDSAVVVEIDLNDDELTRRSESLDRELKNVLWSSDDHELDFSHYHRKPYEYQLVGIQWILGMKINHRTRGAILADDMGLGKTFMCLAGIDQCRRIESVMVKGFTPKPTLIVAPLSLLENWKQEIEKTFKVEPFDDVVVLQTSKDLKKYRLARNTASDEPALDTLMVGSKYSVNRLDIPNRLVLTTYETLRDHQISLCKVDWSFVVFDEAQKIKNPNAIASRAARGLKSEFNLVATGTPVENTLADLWCLMDTASPGKLDAYQSFRSEFIKPIISAKEDEKDAIKVRIGRKLREKVGASMLRRLKEDELDGIPDKKTYVGSKGSCSSADANPCELLLASVMTGRQLKIYEDIASGLHGDSKNNVLTTLHKLRDCSLHPDLLEKDEILLPSNTKDLERFIDASSKLRSVVQILEKIAKRDEKVIVFCINTRLQRLLKVLFQRRFSLANISIINGETKAIKSSRSKSPSRLQLIDEFEKVSGFNIIIMSPLAAGVGLTVVGANNVIHLERHWNPAKEAQATDRVYRLGQKKDVHVFIPILHHPDQEVESFDENLNKLLSNKLVLKDAVVTPESVKPNPTRVGNPDRTIKTIDDIKNLPWEQFEALAALCLSFMNKSDSVRLTAKGSDYGADGVLVSGSKFSLIQAKATKNTTLRGHKAIQEVYGAKKYYEEVLEKEFDKMYLVTSANSLDRKARKFAKTYNVEVLTSGELLSILAAHEVKLSDLMRLMAEPRVSRMG